MGKFIIGTFLMLGFGFYELSGGADFEPEARPIAQATISTKSLEAVPFDEPVVTRAAVETAPLAPIEEIPVVEASLQSAVVDVVEQAIVDLRTVSGNRVNMRAGPGTNFDVLDTLTRGTAAEVIEVNDNGWARIRVTSTDQSGWMAERLLSDS